ncbi:hypothetical protein FACS1894110_01020 [Spirochaetia bacterium]|nr:hypothetical protein FACS1894110_01020 [Spirochaetia bacterium]
MKIKQVELTKFKRFTHLTISEIPASAKLVVLIGPNGCGKTSLFEAFNHWYQLSGFGMPGVQDYFEKKLDSVSTANNAWYNNKVQLSFHNYVHNPNQQAMLKGKFYFRSAYRNEADFNISQLKKQNDPTQSVHLANLMLNDQTVSENYQRLVAKTLAGVYDNGNNQKTVQALREEIIGKIQTSLSNIFDDLNLSSIGDPLQNGSFYFKKGNSVDFHYKNLSAGEKSVFDLILDMIIKSAYFDDAVYCIDEPEVHMHTRLQGKVLGELYNLTPANSQLWVSTHSIGMFKEAESLERIHPGSVVFLDFDNCDFDNDEIIKPTKINKAILEKFYDLAFGDFAGLMVPSKIIFCEGTDKGRRYKNFDAQIYSIIFTDKYPDAKFISLGSCSELEAIDTNAVGSVITSIINCSEIVKLVDRDDRSDAQVQELVEKGIKVTTKRNIESYLLDDVVIAKLCNSIGKPELTTQCITVKQQALVSSIGRGNPPDDYKSASGDVYVGIKQLLQLTQCGDNKCAFFRDTVAPLITEDMDIYRELEQEIFL